MTHAVSRQPYEQKLALLPRLHHGESLAWGVPLYIIVNLIREPVLSKEAYLQERGTLVISHQEKITLSGTSFT